MIDSFKDSKLIGVVVITYNILDNIGIGAKYCHSLTDITDIY